MGEQYTYGGDISSLIWQHKLTPPQLFAKPDSPHNDYTVMEELLQVLSRPYDDPPEQGGYNLPPEPGGEAYKTFCGTWVDEEQSGGEG